MNAARILLEQCGEKASIRKVAAQIELARGKAMRWSDVSEALKIVAGNSRATPRQRFYEERATPRQPSRGRDIRNGIENREDATHPSLPGIDVPAKNGKPAKKASKAPLPGHLILDAVGALVAPHLNGMTMREWRKRNATAAHAMAEGGITPDEAADAWQADSRTRAEPRLFLHYLHNRIAAVRSSAPPEQDLPRFEDLGIRPQATGQRSERDAHG